MGAVVKGWVKLSLRQSAAGLQENGPGAIPETQDVLTVETAASLATCHHWVDVLD